MRPQLVPMSRKTLIGQSKSSTSNNNSASEAAPHPSTSAFGVNSGASQNSSSDRARIALLKSDINLLQSEIDAFRGDPGGFLELQSILDRYHWTIDPIASSQSRDQLTVVLLKKVNELANICQHKVFANSGNKTQQTNSALLLPQNSLVSDLVHFFQMRRILGGTTVATAAAAPVTPSGIADSPSPHHESRSALNVPAAASVVSDPTEETTQVQKLRDLKTATAVDSLHDDPLNELDGGLNSARTPPSPLDSISDVEDDDGVSWAPQGKSRSRKLSKAAPVEQTTAVVVPDVTPPVIPVDQVSQLTRKLEQCKLQIRFFRSLEKHLLLVQNVGEQLQLLATQPAVDALHTSLQRAVDQFYPQGSPVVAAATNAAAAAASKATSSPASPGKKGAAKKEEASSPTSAVDPLSNASVLAQMLSGPLDEKKLRVAVAYQNAVIESLTNSISAQANEDKMTIKTLQEQVGTLKTRLHNQAEMHTREVFSMNQTLDRVANYVRLGTPNIFAATPQTSWIQPSTNLGGIASRPLSRASVADGGDLLGFKNLNKMGLTPPPLHNPAAILPPRPSSSFSVVEVKDHSDQIFGTSTRPASRTTTAMKTKPLVATRAEDLDGEKERRYLQVIRTQSDIIKDLSQKLGRPVPSTANASLTGFGTAQ